MMSPLESGLPRKRKIGSQDPEEESNFAMIHIFVLIVNIFFT
jgi:hypothetical protein